jgi:hypothetical protein
VRATVRAILCGAAVLTIVECARCGGQDDSTAVGLLPRIRSSRFLAFLSPLVLPKLVGDGARMKAFVRSEEFASIRKRVGDRRAVDFLFRTALNLSWDNTFEALLITFVAVMDHRNVGIRLPLIGNAVWVPLTSEFEDDFLARIKALPSDLYADLPPGAGGDRDKLQHFFGSALMTYVSESDDAAARVGDFIEWGEDRFIVGGVNDPRDKRANAEGRRFARALLDDPDALPSAILGTSPLTVPVKSGQPSEAP